MNMLRWPSIRKAKRVVGKTLSFRDATVDDAVFILSLRTDEKKSRYLSKVARDLNAQKIWLNEYAHLEDQAYFVIEYRDEPVGTVRLYDAQQDSFCWGSWIFKDSRPLHAPMESALMVYSYAVDDLGFQSAHFDVRIGNERVWKFHERLGALRVADNNLDYFYNIDKKSIKKLKIVYKKLMPDNVTVIR